MNTRLDVPSLVYRTGKASLCGPVLGVKLAKHPKEEIWLDASEHDSTVGTHAPFFTHIRNFHKMSMCRRTPLNGSWQQLFAAEVMVTQQIGGQRYEQIDT